MKKATYLLLALLVLLILPVTAMAAEEISVQEMIDALPTVEEFKAMDADAQLEAYNRTQAAYDAYAALSREEKAQLEGAEEIFEALFSHYNTLVAPAETVEETKTVQFPWVGTITAAIMVLLIRNQREKEGQKPTL